MANDDTQSKKLDTLYNNLVEIANKHGSRYIDEEDRAIINADVTQKLNETFKDDSAVTPKALQECAKDLTSYIIENKDYLKDIQFSFQEEAEEAHENATKAFKDKISNIGQDLHARSTATDQGRFREFAQDIIDAKHRVDRAYNGALTEDLQKQAKDSLISELQADLGKYNVFPGTEDDALAKVSEHLVDNIFKGVDNTQALLSSSTAILAQNQSQGRENTEELMIDENGAIIYPQASQASVSAEGKNLDTETVIPQKREDVATISTPENSKNLSAPQMTLEDILAEASKPAPQENRAVTENTVTPQDPHEKLVDTISKTVNQSLGLEISIDQAERKISNAIKEVYGNKYSDEALKGYANGMLTNAHTGYVPIQQLIPTSEQVLEAALSLEEPRKIIASMTADTKQKMDNGADKNKVKKELIEKFTANPHLFQNVSTDDKALEYAAEKIIEHATGAKRGIVRRLVEKFNGLKGDNKKIVKDMIAKFSNSSNSVTTAASRVAPKGKETHMSGRS